MNLDEAQLLFYVCRQEPMTHGLLPAGHLIQRIPPTVTRRTDTRAIKTFYTTFCCASLFMGSC